MATSLQTVSLQSCSVLCPLVMSRQIALVGLLLPSSTSTSRSPGLMMGVSAVKNTSSGPTSGTPESIVLESMV